MTITLPHAPAPRSAQTRAMGQATVLMRRGSGLTAAASALVTPYEAGTDTPYPGALYAGPDATTPLVFPVATGEDGVVELWADGPARIDLEAAHPTWGANRVTLDLEPAPSPGVTLTADASLAVAEGPPETFALAVRRAADAGNTLELRAGGLYVPVPPERGTLTYRYSSTTSMADPGAGFLRANGASGAGITELALDVLTDGDTDASVLLRAVRAGDHLYVQDQDDSAHWVRFLASASAGDQTGWYRLPVAFLDGSGSALGNNHRIDVGFTLSPPGQTGVDVAITTDASLTATESPDNNFSLSTRLSPDAGNALALRANGLYSTDTTGVGGGGAVDSVNGQTGVVVLDAQDVGALDQTTADGRYATPASVSGAISTHAGAADPHAVYLLESAAFTQATADGRYLQLAAGGTVAGATSFTLRPTVAGVAQPRISVQSGAPSSPATGDVWIW